MKTVMVDMDNVITNGIFLKHINDRVESLEGASKKLLFTAWHNKGISDDELAKQGVIRVDSWWDIGRNLLTEQEERTA